MPKRYWWVIVAYIIMQFSVYLFVPLLVMLFPINRIEASIYYTIFSFIAGLIVVLFLMKPDMKIKHERNDSGFGTIILWSIIGVVMAYFTQAIAGVIEMKYFGIQPESENTDMIIGIARTFPLFVIVPALVAPILEEIIFRKIIFGTLYSRTNFFIAALLSALIFGIIHGEPEHLLIYASMGFVFAYLYVKTKRILVPIIVHMTLNSISVIGQMLLTPEQIEEMRKQLQMILFGG